MKHSELKYLIEADLIDNMVIQGDWERSYWEIAPDVVRTVSAKYVTVLDGARVWVLEDDQGIQVFSDLNAAYQVVRALGWHGLVTVAG